MTTEDGFKNAMACWASGVTVVTTRTKAGLSYGITASSFSSVSLDPPLVSVCIHNHSPILEMIDDTDGFAVSVLGVHQEAASNHFASRGREPAVDFGDIASSVVDGQRILDGSNAMVTCTVHEKVLAGDHTILIGRVNTTVACEADPLIYYRRAYRTVTD